ncbi:SRPBCC family protein [Streptomonospora sp. S1-112]|uniref:SRPBCC family protein n=1 Tax=Streptomonospora mangrovi TaxID=2883123 RepID=A0A9X3SFV3_9ACTN|nr:SRPBCC family protein [Streptomonospora mangrovi]MDA0565275.1 SRPBCC family protein [Streptomonospora mangrovi]
MRYAEGPSTERETAVAAPPERVWSLVTDIALPCAHSPELQRVEWLPPATEPVEGARFAGFNRHPRIGEWRTVSQVVEVKPESAFAWAVLDVDGRFGPPMRDAAAPMALWRFALEPRDGGTLVRQSVRLGPGPSGLSVVIDRMPEREEMLVAHRIEELATGMEAVLEGLRVRAETGG